MESSGLVTNDVDTAHQEENKRVVLGAGLTTEFIILVLNFYLALAFGLHGKKSNMLKSRSNRDMHRGFVYKIAVAAVSLPFLRYICTLAFIFRNLLPDGIAGCELIADFAYVGLTLGLIPTYIFLWARQRAFYSHPYLTESYGRPVEFLSKFVLVPILVQGLVLAVLATHGDEYEVMNGGCVIRQSVTGVDYREYLYAATLVINQIILLGLFINSILTHVKTQNNARRKPSENANSESAVQSVSHVTSTMENSMKAYANAPYQSSPAETPLPIESASEKKKNEVLTVKNHGTVIETPEDTITDENSISGMSKNELAIGNLEAKLDIPISGVYQDDNKSNRLAVAWRRQGNRVTNFVRRTVHRRDTITDRGGKVLKLIKRTLYLALISILSDISVLIFIAIWSEKIPVSTQFVMYDLSMFINVVSVTASFDNWPGILKTPCTTTWN